LRIFELEVYGKLAEALSVKKYEKQAFTLYPNPVTNGILNISGDQEVESVEVYSILGNKIDIPFDNNQLQVSALAAGTYFLRINNKYSLKFIKK
jgi:Secretion system C-terminal sorting domain